MRFKVIIIGFAIIMVIMASFCYANDLDDGIPIDGQPISNYDNVNRDTNISFIKLRAKAKAESEANAAQNAAVQDASGSINSVVAGPGTTIKGDVIIIDEGKGNKTIVVDTQ